MARTKKTKKETDENNGINEEITNTPIDDELDFFEYVTESSIKLGTDFRKKINVRMDGKKRQLAIRPLASEELYQIQQQSEIEGTPLHVLIVHNAAYGVKSGKQIPLHILEDKIPAGVVTYIADRISEFTGYGIEQDDLDDLKKN